MIKSSFLRNFFAKNSAETQSSKTEKPIIISAYEHKIAKNLISNNAIKVINSLQKAGYQAYIVGGAVRDLLLGITPKDFDVTTDATPEQVQSLFHRAHIIGRRFRIVHVNFRDNEFHENREIIEVSTFRAFGNNSQSNQIIPENHGLIYRLLHKKRLKTLDKHNIDARGRILRDNVWGTQAQDAKRRDFRINALYYNPSDQTLYDYHHGLDDIKERKLQIIGDPQTRYREDPVRMLRAIRFAAKIRFAIAKETAEPIVSMAHLLKHVPSARIFDEILKLLFSGNVYRVAEQLRKICFPKGLLPLLDIIAFHQANSFIALAIASTDKRVADGQHISVGFLFAALLWHEVQESWCRQKSHGILSIPALHVAMDEVLEKQNQQLAIQKRYIGDMKDIWLMQVRFEKRTGKAPLRLLEAQRFRAGYDFLMLRCAAGNSPEELGLWWTQFQTADLAGRVTLLEQAKNATATASTAKNKKRGSKNIKSYIAGDSK